MKSIFFFVRVKPYANGQVYFPLDVKNLEVRDSLTNQICLSLWWWNKDDKNHYRDQNIDGNELRGHNWVYFAHRL